MITLSATAFFWFITLGLLVGLTFGAIIRKEGIPMAGNLAWAVAGSVVSGTIGISFGLGDGLLFALIGTLAVLFLANVFHQHHEEDMFGNSKQKIRIKKG